MLTKEALRFFLDFLKLEGILDWYFKNYNKKKFLRCVNAPYFLDLLRYTIDLDTEELLQIEQRWNNLARRFRSENKWRY